MSIAVDSTFGLISGGCQTKISSNSGVCSGGRRKFMTWIHTPVAAPAAIVVMLGWRPGTSDIEKDAEITYGDKHLLQRAVTAKDATGTRDGAVSVYVLKSEEGIPTGPQRIRVNFTSDSGPRLAVSLALTCAADKWIDVVDTGTFTGPSTNPFVTLSPGDAVPAFLVGALYYGRAGINLSHAVLDPDYTSLDSSIYVEAPDQGLSDFAYSDGMSGGGDATISWTLATAGDSVAIAAAALIEIDAGTELAGRIPFVVAKTFDIGFGPVSLPVEALAGHTAIVFARNDGNATIPTLTAGWTTFASGVDTQGRGWIIATREIQEGDTSIGSWTNGSSGLLLVYDGAGPNIQTFIGAYAVGAGNATSWTYPALARTVTSRRGWIVRVNLYGGGSTDFECAAQDRPAGVVNVTSNLTEQMVTAAHTPRPTDSVIAAASAQTGPAGRWTAFALEIFSNYKVIGEPGDWVWEITDGELPPGLTLNTDTGAVTGTPTTPGKYRFRYSAHNNFQTIAEQECVLLVDPESKLRKVRDIMVLGTDVGAVLIPDAIEDFASSLSAEEGVVCAVRGKAYAPDGTDGEVVFRRLYVTGYHRAAIGLWIVPVIDGRPLHELRTWFHRPAPASGTEERFSALVTLTKEHPDYPGAKFGVRGSTAEVYVETTDPENRIHLESAAWAHEPINLARIRRVGEAERS